MTYSECLSTSTIRTHMRRLVASPGRPLCRVAENISKRATEVVIVRSFLLNLASYGVGKDLSPTYTCPTVFWYNADVQLFGFIDVRDAEDTRY